jgi:outer membrane protein TolC
LIFVFAASCSCPEMLSASEKINPGPQLETRVLSIQEVVQMALGHSPEAMLAKAQIMRAGEAVRETRSLNRPQLYTGTGLAYNNGFPLSIEGSAPSIFQVAATQSIFSKKNANLIHEAEESMKASRFGSDSVRNDLALKTALAYYRLHRARRIITLTSERLDAAHKQQELVEAQYEAGRVRPVDLTLAQTSTMAAGRPRTGKAWRKGAPGNNRSAQHGFNKNTGTAHRQYHLRNGWRLPLQAGHRTYSGNIASGGNPEGQGVSR